MNIKQLKKILEDLPDDLVCVMPGNDHSYNEITVAQPADAEKSTYGDLSEFYDTEVLAKGSQKVKVVVFV